MMRDNCSFLACKCILESLCFSMGLHCLVSMWRWYPLNMNRVRIVIFICVVFWSIGASICCPKWHTFISSMGLMIYIHHGFLSCKIWTFNRLVVQILRFSFCQTFFVFLIRCLVVLMVVIILLLISVLFRIVILNFLPAGVLILLTSRWRPLFLGLLRFIIAFIWLFLVVAEVVILAILSIPRFFRKCIEFTHH